MCILCYDEGWKDGRLEIGGERNIIFDICYKFSFEGFEIDMINKKVIK